MTAVLVMIKNYENRRVTDDKNNKKLVEVINTNSENMTGRTIEHVDYSSCYVS